MTSPEVPSILVIGGTGAQGSNVVRELVRDKKYIVTILTRDITSISAVALGELGNVTLIPGSCEIAVQSGVKRLIYSGGSNRPKGHRYAEEYSNSHQATGGSTEVLSILLRPLVLPDNTHIFAAPIGDGFIPFAELATYGKYVCWAFDNPSRSVGKHITLPTYPTTLRGVAEAFEKVTGKKAVAKDVTQDEWFEAAKSYVDPDAKQPSNIPVAPEGDDTRFTFRHKALRLDVEAIRKAQELANEIYPDRFKSVEDWMRAMGYTGEAKAEMKHDRDRKRTL
ncbi:hypothetical protein DFH08DRAFT_825348 [Mycena albidolilacea]|uniref:NmrA-like domain-containing protein n=1 Tax=Mycena albidolilacea TaxID=1033008 RepID=A0AAD7EAB5_9AGAR|nr:hypothetical protein DFH08DRAFT_825348 [Mycena albidolilacea]